VVFTDIRRMGRLKPNCDRLAFLTSLNWRERDLAGSRSQADLRVTRCGLRVAQWEPLGLRFACYACNTQRSRPHSQHSHEIVVKESVQGAPHCGGICTMVGIEASASNERLDFALAEFDAEEPQAPAPPFAVPKHTGGRRRTRQLFRGRR
jgi:hypothetical protein